MFCEKENTNSLADAITMEVSWLSLKRHNFIVVVLSNFDFIAILCRLFLFCYFEKFSHLNAIRASYEIVLEKLL